MPRAGLTPETILREAIGLADAEGLAAVTPTALAQRLGVRPPSLYKHVAGLGEILDSMAQRGVEETNRRLLRATAGLAGDDALLALARAYWDFAHQHPGLYAASLRAPPADGSAWAKAGEETVETVLAVLRGYRLAGADALHATRGLRAILHGFLSLDAAGGFGLPLDVEESFLRMVQLFADGLRREGEALIPAGVRPPPGARRAGLPDR
jgi:AcrR family transcriptional regulator